MPCGLAFGDASGKVGTPVGFEKRTVTGTALAKWTALLSDGAAALGVKVPVRTMPLA